MSDHENTVRPGNSSMYELLRPTKSYMTCSERMNTKIHSRTFKSTSKEMCTFVDFCTEKALVIGKCSLPAIMHPIECVMHKMLTSPLYRTVYP